MFLLLNAIDAHSGHATFKGDPEFLFAWGRHLKTHQGQRREPQLFYGGDNKHPVGKLLDITIGKDDGQAYAKALIDDTETLRMLDSGTLTGISFHNPGSVAVVDRPPERLGATFKSTQRDGTILRKSFQARPDEPTIVRKYNGDGSYRLTNPHFCQRPNRNAY